jgi:hypothetical protein
MGSQECGICLENIENATCVTSNNGMCHCIHQFCQKCVVELVKGLTDMGRPITCPLCRAHCVSSTK